MFKARDFFSEENSFFEPLFGKTEYVWEGLKNISPFIADIISPNISSLPLNGPLVKETLTLDNGAKIFAGAALAGEKIEIGAGAVVEPGAYIGDYSIIGPRTQVRQGAYVRGNLLSGPGCVIGHCTEVKNSCLLGNSKAGHFAYIGDSLLGEVNLGAGTKLANLKLSGSAVKLKVKGKTILTGLRKLGAVIADGCQSGCNSVTSPGTLLSKNCFLYPCASARGYYGPNSLIKLKQQIIVEEKK